MTPTVRIIEDLNSTAVGSWVGGEDNRQIRKLGDLYTVTVHALRDVTEVQVHLTVPALRAWYGEHLGMQVDVSRTPPTWVQPVAEYPGPLQMPIIAAYSGSVAYLLAALDSPVSCYLVGMNSAQIGFRLVWRERIPAGTTRQLRFFYAEKAGDQQAALFGLLDAVRPHVCPKWTNIDIGHGQIDVQLQDQSEPMRHLARMWADYGHQFKRIQCWGQQGDGQCCSPKLGMIDGLDEFACFLQSQGTRLGLYMRPDMGDGVPDNEWLRNWRLDFADTRQYTSSPVFYIDTAGFRDMRKCMAGIQQHDAIEGATLSLPNPALVSNCLSGGAFSPDGKARYPKTLPDGTPHPLNPEPWVTADPRVGKYLERDRTMILGAENMDYAFDGLYWTTVNGQRKEWTDFLWRSCLMLDLPMSPRNPGNPTVQAIVNERNRVGWLDMDRQWEAHGLWTDRKTGKRWKVEGLSIVEVA